MQRLRVENILFKLTDASIAFFSISSCLLNCRMLSRFFRSEPNSALNLSITLCLISDIFHLVVKHMLEQAVSLSVINSSADRTNITCKRCWAVIIAEGWRETFFLAFGYYRARWDYQKFIEKIHKVGWSSGGRWWRNKNLHHWTYFNVHKPAIYYRCLHYTDFRCFKYMKIVTDNKRMRFDWTPENWRIVCKKKGHIIVI